MILGQVVSVTVSPAFRQLTGNDGLYSFPGVWLGGIKVDIRLTSALKKKSWISLEVAMNKFQRILTVVLK